MPLLSLLSLGTCQHLSADSYCSVYSQVVRQKGDGAISAPSEVKRRILANEVTFRELCGGKK
jgi:hypothetical protein